MVDLLRGASFRVRAAGLSAHLNPRSDDLVLRDADGGERGDE